MKKWQWLALALVVAIGGCGTDDSVSPSPDLAAAWVGEYAGAGSYSLSNGQSGVEQPATLLIEAVNPKQIMISAQLIYGTGRNDEANAWVMVTPEATDELETQFRQGTSRIVLTLSKEEDVIRGTIVTTTLRIGGNWTEDQSMTIEVARQ